jgi:excisionase family DNA binding protein
MNDKFYTVDEFAEMVKMSPQTIRRCIRKGRIMACRPAIGKKSPYRIHASEIMRILSVDYQKIVEERNKLADSQN